MHGHKVVTIERGDGYAARCETCGDITFGGFPTRTEAREALTHEEAPDAAATAVEGEIQNTSHQEENQTMPIVQVDPTATLADIAIRARAEGVAPSLLVERALATMTVNDVISEEVRILIADRDLATVQFADMTGIPVKHIERCFHNRARWTLADAFAIEDAFDNDWFRHCMRVMQSSVEVGRVVLNAGKHDDQSAGAR